MSLEQED